MILFGEHIVRLGVFKFSDQSCIPCAVAKRSGFRNVGSPIFDNFRIEYLDFGENIYVYAYEVISYPDICPDFSDRNGYPKFGSDRQIMDELFGSDICEHPYVRYLIIYQDSTWGKVLVVVEDILSFLLS